MSENHACARGEANPLTGEYCPYQQHAPHTEEGFEVWDVIMRGGGQLRVGMGGAVLGFDIEALITISRALGYDTNAFLHLFHHAERGMMAGRYTHGNRNDEKYLDPSGGDRR